MESNDFQWVTKCIESCTNEWQLTTAYELIVLVEKKYPYNEKLHELKNIYLTKQNLILCA